MSSSPWLQFRRRHRGTLKALSAMYRDQSGWGLGSLPVHENRGRLGRRDNPDRLRIWLGKRDHLSLHPGGIEDHGVKIAGPVEIIKFQSPDGTHEVNMYLDIGGRETLCNPCKPPQCRRLLDHMLDEGGVVIGEIPSDALVNGFRTTEPSLLTVLNDYSHRFRRLYRIDLRTAERARQAVNWIRWLPDPSDAPNEVYHAMTELIEGRDYGFFYDSGLGSWYNSMTDYGFSPAQVDNLVDFLRDMKDDPEVRDALKRLARDTSPKRSDINLVLSYVIALNALKVIANNTSTRVHLVCSLRLGDHVTRLLTTVLGYRVVGRSGDRVVQCTRIP